jgi:hypothetical protein
MVTPAQVQVKIENYKMPHYQGLMIEYIKEEFENANNKYVLWNKSYNVLG